jgi:hypothetical protein
LEQQMAIAQQVVDPDILFSHWQPSEGIDGLGEGKDG